MRPSLRHALQTKVRTLATVGVLALCPVFSACSGALQGTESAKILAPDSGWHRLRSPHFTLWTNLPRHSAETSLRAYESLYDVLATAIYRGRTSPQLHTQVVVFRDHEDFVSFSRNFIAVSYFFDKLPQDLESQPTIVTYGDISRLTQVNFLHELTHRFMRHALGPMPPWLDEGLASYYAGLGMEGDRIVLGKRDILRQFTGKSDWYSRNQHTHSTTEIPIAELPSPLELMAMDGQRFYAGRNRPRSDIDAHKAETGNYGGAWALVHLLLHGPEHYGLRFSSAMEDVAHGERVDRALRQHLSDLRPEQLERDYWIHVQKLRHTPWTLPRPTSSAVKLDVASLDLNEVDVLWARLSVDREHALGYLQRALRRDPSDPDVHYMMGTVIALAGDSRVAEQHFRRSLARRPNDPGFLYALGWLYGYDPTAWPEATRRAELQAIIEALTIHAFSPAQLDTAAWYRAAAGELDVAAKLVARAIAQDPNCWHCFDTLAKVRFAQGYDHEAVQAQTSALDRMPAWVPNATQSAFYGRLVEYRVAWAKHSDGRGRDQDQEGDAFETSPRCAAAGQSVLWRDQISLGR